LFGSCKTFQQTIRYRPHSTRKISLGGLRVHYDCCHPIDFKAVIPAASVKLGPEVIYLIGITYP